MLKILFFKKKKIIKMKFEKNFELVKKENDLVLKKFDRIKNEEIRQREIINYFLKDWRIKNKKKQIFNYLKQKAKNSKKRKIVK